jgi:hypothetical protein
VAQSEGTGTPAEEAAQMTDLLLEWMSFRGAGRSDDLPAELISDSPARRVMNDFAILGHLELASPTSWRITPPVLAALPVGAQGVSSVLCGARTRGVLNGIAAACAREGAQMVVMAVPDRPSLVNVTAESKTVLASVAEAAGIAFQNDAAFTLLACTPAIRDWPRTPCAMVAGRVDTVRRFSRSKIGWVSSTLAEATAAKAGFFRIRRDWDWVSLLKGSVSECAYIDDRVGRFATATRLRAVSWNGGSRILSLPGQLYPPGTIARALTLCTGALPRFDAASRRISFAGVTPEILRLTLAITGLRLA